MRKLLYIFSIAALLVAHLAYAQTSKHILGFTFKPVRDADVDKIIVSWRTDFAADSASMNLTGDAGNKHIQIPRNKIEPQQVTEGAKIVASVFRTEFSYGSGKDIFPELQIVHLEAAVRGEAESLTSSIDIDLTSVGDYFSTLNRSAELQKQVADLQVKKGQVPPAPKVTVEQVRPLDTSISMHVSTDTAVRLRALAYLGSTAADVIPGREIQKSDSQTVASGDPKVLIIRNLPAEKQYVLAIQDERGKPLAEPILADQSGGPLKTLKSIGHAHVAITGQIVKPKETTLNLIVRNTARVKATIQRQTPTGNWEDFGTKDQDLKPTAEETQVNVTVSVNLDPDHQYRAIVIASTEFDDAEKNDVATSSKSVTGVRTELFKSLAVKFTSDTLVLSTQSNERVKMKCTATLPKISKVVPGADISMAEATTAPSCEFKTSDLLGPQIADASSDKNKPKAPPIITFVVDVVPDDQTGRSQTQTLALSADLPTKDTKGNTINYAAMAKSLGPSGDGKVGLKATGILGNIVRMFVAIAPSFL